MVVVALSPWFQRNLFSWWVVSSFQTPFFLSYFIQLWHENYNKILIFLGKITILTAAKLKTGESTSISLPFLFHLFNWSSRAINCLWNSQEPTNFFPSPSKPPLSLTWIIANLFTSLPVSILAPTNLFHTLQCQWYL